MNYAGFGVIRSMIPPLYSYTQSDEVYWDRTTGIVCERLYQERLLRHVPSPIPPSPIPAPTNHTSTIPPSIIPPYYNSSMSYSLTLIDTNLWGSCIFPVTVDSQNFIIHATSNSSISNFEFNQTLNQVSFNVRGFTGTSGFINVTIPQNLLSGEFSVYKDGSILVKDVDYTQIYNGTHYIFHITYSHSIHTIEIRGTEVIPEFTTTLLLPLFLILTLIALVLTKKFDTGNNKSLDHSLFFP